MVAVLLGFYYRIAYEVNSAIMVFAQSLYAAATALALVATSQAAALATSPTAIVAGKTFDRFVQIFLENQDYDIAIGDRKFVIKRRAPAPGAVIRVS